MISAPPESGPLQRLSGMQDDELVQQMDLQVQEALSSLGSIPHGDAVAARMRISEARRSYDTLTELLPRVTLSGRRRVDFLMKLADLRNRLLRAGEPI